MAKTSPKGTCPACRAPATGNFCTACGANLAPRPCSECAAPLEPGARFCHACGRAASESGARAAGVGRPPQGDRTPWILAGVLSVALLAALLALMLRDSPTRPTSTPNVVAAPSASGMPDLASLTPREQFDRLYNRVMQAAEGGDATTLGTFMPMALMAYQQLPDSSRDADARYHAAMLKLHSNDAAGALALADTILAENPKHLFGHVIRGNAAKWQQDEGALASARRDFVKYYDAEIKAGRPEYGHHQTLLDGFREEAKAAGG